MGSQLPAISNQSLNNEDHFVEKTLSYGRKIRCLTHSFNLSMRKSAAAG